MFKKSLLVKILSIVIGITIIGFGILIYKVIEQEKSSLLEERKKTSELMAQPLLHTIYKDMLDERADMTRYLVEGMKTVKGTERVQVIRGNGIEEAFQDFKTLKAVEKEYGDLKPEWIADHPNKANNVARGIDNPKFKEAIEFFSKGKKQGISYVEESGGKRLFTYLTPIEVRPKCKACHTTTEGARGILMISTSLEDMYAALSASRTQWIMYGLFTVLGTSILLALFVNAIIRPLSKMAESSRKIASGDLDVRIDVKSNDEIGILAHAFKEMIASLRSIVGQIRNGSEQVASASSEIAATAEQNSRNSESAATTVEEITSTMRDMSANIQNVAKSIQFQATAVAQTSSLLEELIASIQRVAYNAKRLAALSGKAIGAVNSGKNAVDKSSSGMKSITKVITKSGNAIRILSNRAEDIGRIVEVIDDIAEQTNLLALNAAIEASRAGEHGMGFAVVAEEVRKLAERSAKSTKEIAELIYGIQKETQSAVNDVEKNVEIVEQAITLSTEVVDSLKNIESTVAEFSKYSAEISAATSEQANGCDQINKTSIKLNEITLEVSASANEQASEVEQIVKAIEKVRDVVQQNASGATKLAASAEELSKQSDTLIAAAGRFVLEDEEIKSASEKDTPIS